MVTTTERGRDAANDRGRVLVVDDQSQVRDLLREFVEHLGYEASTAASGEQAIAAMATVQPHVVFLDLLMPGISGLEVLSVRPRASPHRAGDRHHREHPSGDRGSGPRWRRLRRRRKTDRPERPEGSGRPGHEAGGLPRGAPAHDGSRADAARMLTPDEPTVRERLRTLIHSGVLPRVPPTPVWARPCREPHPCTACGSVIAARETEFEIVTPARVILLHVRCMNLWPA